MDATIAVMSKQMGAQCLPRRLVRGADGLVDCDVFWDLPEPALAPITTPTTCGQPGWEFLLDPGPDHPKPSGTGREVCKVAQLAVKADVSGMLTPMLTRIDDSHFDQGWYYDDFSDDAAKECRGDTKQRIAFSAGAKPPDGRRRQARMLGRNLEAPAAHGRRHEHRAAAHRRCL